jgi:hypothetical protein
MALSGRRWVIDQCPLSGVKQTSQVDRAVSANDPERKSSPQGKPLFPTSVPAAQHANAISQNRNGLTIGHLVLDHAGDGPRLGNGV